MNNVTVCLLLTMILTYVDGIHSNSVRLKIYVVNTYFYIVVNTCDLLVL